ncbi:hypothetical protein CI109_102757 [Kwoniella shandongensis]|uniref:Uncharacterized protein n=1 Tax=Kwoniella shandongensis TaxID=1734106 RepID=A0A5M6BV39_9TREE|nr:uncharacterized protein CI109_004921 [Kwoniella shandongensis]KAA5526718.1 hypothetical protein CI109_004921 [Kwoniella shandongensis]
MTRYSQLLTTLLGLTTFALLNVNAAALPIETSVSLLPRDADALGFSEWPAVGHSSAHKKRKRETNGDRIKRGLNPLPPQKRSPTPTHQLVPRLSPAPLTSRQYTFQRCAGSFSSDNGENEGTGQSATVQEAVDACADLTTTAEEFNFVVRYLSDNTYLCRYGLTKVNDEACDDTNFGYYESPVP